MGLQGQGSIGFYADDGQQELDFLQAGQRSPTGLLDGPNEGPGSTSGSESGADIQGSLFGSPRGIQRPSASRQVLDSAAETRLGQAALTSGQAETAGRESQSDSTPGIKGSVVQPVIPAQSSAAPSTVSASVQAIETQYAQTLELLRQQQSTFMTKVHDRLASLETPGVAPGLDQPSLRKPPVCIKKPVMAGPSVLRGPRSTSVPTAMGSKSGSRKGPAVVPAEVASLYTAKNAASGLPPEPAANPVQSTSSGSLPLELKGYEVDLSHFRISDLVRDTSGPPLAPAVDILANPQLILKHLSAGSVPPDVRLLAQSQLLRHSAPVSTQASVAQSRLRSTDLGSKPLAELTNQVDFIQRQVLEFMLEEQAWDQPPVADPPNTAFQPAKQVEAEDGPAVMHGMPVPAMLARHVLECWEHPGQLRPSRIIKKVPRLWRDHFDTFCSILQHPSKAELDAFHLTIEGFMERLQAVDRLAGFRRAGRDLRTQGDLLRVQLNSAAWVQFQVASQTDCYQRLGTALDALQKVPGVPAEVTAELEEARSDIEGQLLASWCQFCVCFAGVDCAARCIAALVLQLRTDACRALWGLKCPKLILDEILAGPVNSAAFFGQDISALMGKLAQHHTILQLNSAVAVQMGGEPMLRAPKRQAQGPSGPRGQGKKRKVDFRGAAQQGTGSAAAPNPPSKQPFPGQGRGRGRKRNGSRRRSHKKPGGRGQPSATD